jgi:hypothetical protein
MDDLTLALVRRVISCREATNWVSLVLIGELALGPESWAVKTARDHLSEYETSCLNAERGGGNDQ